MAARTEGSAVASLCAGDVMTAPAITVAPDAPLRAELLRDESVILLGEEIGVFEGSYKITAGPLAEFGPARVRQPHRSHEWFPLTEGSPIRLDRLPREFATDALIDRLTRMRPGETVEVRSARPLDAAEEAFGRRGMGHDYGWAYLEEGPSRWWAAITRALARELSAGPSHPWPVLASDGRGLTRGARWIPATLCPGRGDRRAKRRPFSRRAGRPAPSLGSCRRASRR